MALDGRARDEAESVMHAVYESWVAKAWTEVTAAMQADGLKGKPGGEAYSFSEVAIRTALDTKQVLRDQGRSHRAAGWVAANLGERCGWCGGSFSSMIQASAHFDTMSRIVVN